MLELLKDVFSLILALAGIALVLYLCYVLSKYLANRINNVNKSGNLRILERVALAQDKGLAIAELCGRYYLIGFSANSVDLLRELDKSELHFPDGDAGSKFLSVLTATIQSRMDMRASEKNKQRAGESGESPKDEPKE